MLSGGKISANGKHFMAGWCKSCGAALATGATACSFCGRIPVPDDPVPNLDGDARKRMGKNHKNAVAEKLNEIDQEIAFLREQCELTKHPSISLKIANLEKEKQHIKKASS